MATDKRQVFAYIWDHSKEHGSAPTIREIGDAFGIRSTNGVRHHLRALEDAGYIRLLPRKSRGIQVLAAPGETEEEIRNHARAGARPTRVHDRRAAGTIPLVGRIAAGAPLLAEDNIEDRLELGGVFPGDDLFALRVTGHSMKDRGILDGDLVVLRQQQHARNGDVVAALLGDDATLKTFRTTAEGYDLVPANPDFEVRHVGPDDEFRVVGVVVGLLRTPLGPP